MIFMKFGADPNKNPDLVKLNVVFWGNCWALVDVWTLPSYILVGTRNLDMFGELTVTFDLWRLISSYQFILYSK